MTAREQAQARDRVARHLLEQRERELQADLERIMRDHQRSTSWHREAIQLREIGFSYPDISRELGVPRSNIIRVCQEAGLPRTIGSADQARRLRQLGLSYRQIMHRTHLSYRQVRNICESAGEVPA